MNHEKILQVIREQVDAATAQAKCEADYATGKLKDTLWLKTQAGKDKIVKYTKEQVIARCVEKKKKKTAPTRKAPFAIKPQENRTIKKSELIKIIKEEIANVIEGEDEDRYGDGQDLMAYLYGYDQRTHQPDPGDGSFTDAERADPSDPMTGPTRTLDAMMTSSEKTDELIAVKKQELERVTAAIKRLTQGRPGDLSTSQKDALLRRRKQRDQLLAAIEDLESYRFGRDI